MGRATEGVRGLNIKDDDHVVGMVVVRRPDTTLLVASELGMGKRSLVEDYRLQGRGGKGVINLKISEKTGQVVAIKSVTDDDQLMVITRNGIVNRQRVDEIRVIGRATQGVRLVNLDEGDVVMDVARVISDDEDLVGEGDLDGPTAEGDVDGSDAEELSAESTEPEAG